MKGQNLGLGIVTSVLSVALAAGCGLSYKQDVRYDLSDVPRLTGGPLQNATLAVREFPDERPQPDLVAKGSLDKAGVVERDGDDWWVNSDDRYKAWFVNAEISRMIAEHLAASGLFKKVNLESDLPESDLFLEGVVERFEAYRDREATKQALVGMYGLIGVAILLTERSPFEALVVLSQLRLVRRADGKVLWQGTIEESQRGEERISPSGLDVYRHANDALKVAVSKLLEELSRVELPPVSSEPQPAS